MRTPPDTEPHFQAASARAEFRVVYVAGLVTGDAGEELGGD
jgi:hypothetical protein